MKWAAGLIQRDSSYILMFLGLTFYVEEGFTFNMPRVVQSLSLKEGWVTSRDNFTISSLFSLPPVPGNQATFLHLIEQDFHPTRSSPLQVMSDLDLFSALRCFDLISFIFAQKPAGGEQKLSAAAINGMPGSCGERS